MPTAWPEPNRICGGTGRQRPWRPSRRSANGKPVSLASFKGHVTIVDFFFPNCGPCRASFPYMQQIALKYKNRGVTLLAVNGVRGQAPFVMPLMRNTGYDFLPLQANLKWCSDVYHVNEFPSTFLFGRDGRLYFRPHVYDWVSQQVAEGEINELLAHQG